MHHTRVTHAYKHFTLLSSILIFMVVAVLSALTLLVRYEPASMSSCTVDTNLVNSCRPWLGATVGEYPGVGVGGWDLQAHVLDHEQRIGRQLDMVHSYLTPSKPALTNTELYFINRADTIMYVTWKPDNTWGNATGGNAAVNARIDQMADSINAVAPKKILFSVFHEPENDVSGTVPGCVGVYDGGAGTVADYRGMWRNVYNRFNAKGVTNVVWTINFMGFENHNCMIDDLWPGDDIVDWIMWDPYSENTTWDQMISPFYQWLTNNSSTEQNYISKTWGLAEWGAWRNSTRSNTYRLYDGAREALTTQRFPKLKAYVAFDYGDSRVAYDAAGVYDQTEMDKYKQFANHPAFSDPVVTPPSPTPDPNPSPSPSPNPSPTPTAPSPAPTVTVKNGQKVVVVARDTSVKQGQKVTLDSSNLTDQDKVKSIKRVEYYLGAQLIYTATVEPYALDTSVLGAGNHFVTEKVIYRDGTTSENSQTVTVTDADEAAPDTVGGVIGNDDDQQGRYMAVGLGAALYAVGMIGVVATATRSYWRPRLSKLIGRVHVSHPHPRA